MADLEARAVTKRFGGIVALDHVDFDADAGQVHALIGENGAGKSTFIKILTGALRPDEGEVRLFEQPFDARKLVEVAKAVALDPRVLILDEATSALSPKEVQWLLGLARRLASDGLLVIYISHRLAEVREVGDRLTVFRNGRNVGTRDAARVSEEEVVSLMLGRQLERLYPDKQPTAMD